MLKKVIIAFSAILFFATVSTAAAVSFIVTDSDFSGGVYDFTYSTDAGNSGVSINGALQGITDPTLTNSGFTSGGSNGLSRYWNSNGQASGAATLGWNFSAVSGQIASIEIETNQFIFQFSPFGDDAAGDQIFGNLATPASFGSGAYTEIYRYTSDNAANDPNAPAALGSGSLLDVTSLISNDWLLSPDLLELQMGYERTQTSTIPQTHLQLFRETVNDTDVGFNLRVTLAVVPVPAAAWLFGSGLLAIFGFAKRKKRCN